MKYLVGLLSKQIRNHLVLPSSFVLVVMTSFDTTYGPFFSSFDSFLVSLDIFEDKCYNRSTESEVTNETN